MTADHTAVKIIYFFSAFSLSSLLIFWSSKVFERYSKDLTYYNTKQVKQKDADFPTFTICPHSQHKFKDDVLKVREKNRQLLQKYFIHFLGEWNKWSRVLHKAWKGWLPFVVQQYK